MASKKKARKSSRLAKKKAAPARKKAQKKGAKKAVRKPPARKAAPAKPAKAKKAAPKKTKQAVGEGDYAASRTFLKDQTGFVKKNKARIPALGRAAEQALDGAEGASLRAAEASAASHSKAGSGEATIEAAEQEGLDRNAN